jgi:transglutaminase-like putative cysteine protease
LVSRDGSYTLTVDDVRGIALERAIQPHSQRYIGYNRTLDRIVAIDAYTLKPDGRRVRVSAGQIKDQQEAVSSDAPMFQDTRVKVVVFPEVAVGDKLVLHYVLKRASALFPGHFEDLSSSQFYLNKNFTLSYDLPADMPLYADAVGFEPVAVTSPPGRKRYQWRYQPGANTRIEEDSVAYYDYGKRLAVSTFADYAAFARAFQLRAAPAARITPAIAALARQLTLGESDPRARALLLADWVRRNIRYVGVYIGPGGVVPHGAATVLENRYGDCKDHASLLEALLAAAGIDSSGVLINGSSAYRLPPVPTLGIFNHMITYVPSLDLYIDSTADSIAAGYLPDEDLGKPVLLTRSGELARTPDFQDRRDRNTLIFHIGKSGNSLFRVAKTNAGAGAEPYRQAVRDTKQADRDLFVERMLQGFGQRGYGVLDPGKLDGTADEYQMVFAGVSENFADLPGPTGIATAFNFWGGITETVAAFTEEKERKQAFVCHAADSEDETGFEFAPEVSILALPKTLALHGAYFDYTADYAREGNTVTVRRHLVFRPDSVVCTAADFQRMRPLIDQITRDLKSQIIVQAL